MGEASAGNGSQTPFFTSLLPALARQECVCVWGGGSVEGCQVGKEGERGGEDG